MEGRWKSTEVNKVQASAIQKTASYLSEFSEQQNKVLISFVPHVIKIKTKKLFSKDKR